MMTKSKEVKKQIIQLRAKLEADIKATLKTSGLIIMDGEYWTHPSERLIKKYKTVEAWLNSCIVPLSKFAIRNLADSPKIYEFVSAAEVAEFKSKTWPKLKAQYAAARKAKHAENVKDISKLKAKIAKLQAQLEELEG